MTGVHAPRGALRLLFVKNALGFPRAAGHDIRCYEMLRALQRLGHEVGLATVARPVPRALDGLDLQYSIVLAGPHAPPVASNGLPEPSFLQARFASYWGTDRTVVARVADASRAFDADVVVSIGLDALTYLVGITQAVRVWYAGDEWVSHHLSQVHLLRPSTWSEIRPALVKGLYERAHAPITDRVWVVAEHEVAPMRRFAAMKHVDVVTNGVDIDYYQPSAGAEIPRSAVFWGRLDFGPNVQGLAWFCREVWPLVRRRVPDATFRIIGFRPGAEVKALVGAGVELSPDVADIRPEVARHATVVLPFWSGGGIKNKLLEALAMGKPVVCTPQACRGLRGTPPVRIASTPTEWAGALQELWADDAARRRMAGSARQWVTEHHTWRTTALEATEKLVRGERT